MIAFETLATHGICWALGAVTGWGIAYYIVARNTHKRVAVKSLKDAVGECDTCGQITSDLKDGLCAWCQRTYGKGLR